MCWVRYFLSGWTLQPSISFGCQYSDVYGPCLRAALPSLFWSEAWRETGGGRRVRFEYSCPQMPLCSTVGCQWLPSSEKGHGSSGEDPPTTSSPPCMGRRGFSLWLSPGCFTLNPAYSFGKNSFIIFPWECAICVLPFQGQSREDWAVRTQVAGVKILTSTDTSKLHEKPKSSICYLEEMHLKQ